jgi:hypothetical protein
MYKFTKLLPSLIVACAVGIGKVIDVASGGTVCLALNDSGNKSNGSIGQYRYFDPCYAKYRHLYFSLNDNFT